MDGLHLKRQIAIGSISNDAPPLSGLAEKNGSRCCGSFNSPRRARLRDTDSRPNCIRSYYDLSDTSKAALRTQPMDLSKTNHGAACRALNDNPGSPREFSLFQNRVFHKIDFVTDWQTRCSISSYELNHRDNDCILFFTLIANVKLKSII